MPGVTLIYTSSPPHSTQFIGKKLSQKYDIPWVADFRDPWTQDHRYFHPPTLLHKWAILKGEQKTIKQAGRVISVSDVMTQYFQNNYPSQPREKFTTIMNGFDADDYPENKSKTHFESKFVITYAGSFYLHQTPIYFYQGVKLFVEQNPDAEEDLLIQLIGKSQTDYETYPYDIGIGNHIYQTGFVPHREVGKHLANSDIFLLVLWSNPDIVDFTFSGKFFEYLAMEKPILALLNQGACFDLFQKYPIGKTAPFSNIQKISEAIACFYSQWKNKTGENHPNNKTLIESFNRKILTQTLANEFDQVVLNQRKNSHEYTDNHHRKL